MLNYIILPISKIQNAYNHFFNFLIFKLKKIEYQTFPTINGRLFIMGKGTIRFGKEVRINSSMKSNPIGGDTNSIISIGNKATLIIGDFTGFSNTTIICHENIIIGNNVKIGGSVKIYDTDFHSLNHVQRRSSTYDDAKTKKIIIGDDVFIGAHSIILKGVIIGDKSIVGAGSVVTKHIPENQIWAGNPAKFIKLVS